MPLLGGPTKRNGRTSSGAQRWRCTACGASTTVRYDDTVARFDEFLSWLLPKDTQLEMPGAGRTFRRRTAEFWEVWPMPVPDGEFHRVLFVDGIWLAERLVVLICCSEDRVVSWYMAQSENSRAWSALMEPIPAPDVVVADGGGGFAKAVRAAWPRTKVQRCLFHAYAQVKRCTTTRPKLQAGRELYPDRPRPHAHQDAAPGGAVARALSRLVRLLVGLPGGHHARRRKEGVYAREAQEGEEVALVAGLRGNAVHLPRPRAHEGRAAPIHQ